MSGIKVYAIRHLQTEWNGKNLLQGSTDIPIIDNKNLELNKDLLKLSNLPAFSSTLIRTQQTALCYGFSEVKTSEYLNEMNFGDFEGKDKHHLLINKEAKWEKNPFCGSLSSNLLELEERIHSFKCLLKSSNIHEVVVFGHGAWIRLAIAKYKLNNKNLMNTFKIENAECNIFFFDF